MNTTKLQSQILAALLVVSAASSAALPSFAATASVSSAITAPSSQVVTRDKALTDQVMQLLDAKQYDEAMNVVTQAINGNSKNAVAYLLKAIVLYVEQQPTEAVIEQINIAISIAPNYADALYSRASIYESVKDYQNALKDYAAVVAIDSTNIDAVNACAGLSYELKDWNGMLTYVNMLIQNKPDDGNLYYERAYANIMLGQKDAAIADLQQAQKFFIASNQTDKAKDCGDAIAQLENA
ncbi:MAG TPA: tetratricopeptide repeat protein [Drouetiella sp.]